MCTRGKEKALSLPPWAARSKGAPPGLHEAAIHNCEKVYPETIRESLKDLNREMPSDDDFLSGKVYYYNRGKDRIEVVLEY